ncbi:MAG TPA: PilZ domain-containing protein [Candidatus Polarisedimenticolaceae bacterium]|nr:PilZ domain-containing protein [Candidatus Polarisedimenticolaceae bacterium]
MTTILLGKECSPFLETDDSVLQRSEVHVVWAETTDAFIPLAREHRPALVVLDPHVAGFDAFACARGILEAVGESVSVLVIGNTADQERAEAAGVAGIVTRPLTQARLVEAIRRYAPVVEREQARAEVAIKVDFVHVGVEGLAYTRDLAAEGCFLLTHESFKVGDHLALAFHLPGPGGREVRTPAEVVRVQPTGIAVRFTGLAPADRVEIGRFLRSRGRGVA